MVTPAASRCTEESCWHKNSNRLSSKSERASLLDGLCVSEIVRGTRKRNYRKRRVNQVEQNDQLALNQFLAGPKKKRTTSSVSRG